MTTQLQLISISIYLIKNALFFKLNINVAAVRNFSVDSGLLVITSRMLFCEDLRNSATLRRVGWYVVTDLSAQYNFPILKS